MLVISTVNGLADVIIGSPWASPAGKTKVGNSYVIFGSTNATILGNGSLTLDQFIDGVHGFVLYGELTADESGYSVCCGDINSDRFSDIIMGAPNAGIGTSVSPLHSGKVYIMFGGNPLMVQSQQMLLRSGQTLRLSASNFNVSYTDF